MLLHEVCNECNLTKKAVEYYSEKGLIRPEIMENGYRLFSKADVSELKRIAVLRGLGFSVSEIYAVLERESPSAIYSILNKKELEIAEMQIKQDLIRQLAENGDWERMQIQVEALQSKQSILTRILGKFPGYYGKFVCSHFAPFLGEAITTKNQKEAFDTIVSFLDGITIVLPVEIQEYLDELQENVDTAIIFKASSALEAITEDPERSLRDNKVMLEQYSAVIETDEYKSSHAYRLQEYLKQLQNENFSVRKLTQ